MYREPAFETTDWFMSQVYPVFWPFLFWSLARFEARCAAIRAARGEGAMVVYHVHWWGWIEISDVWLAEAVKPDWQTKAEALVARLLSPVLGVAESFADAEEQFRLRRCSEFVSTGSIQGLSQPAPVFQDSG